MSIIANRRQILKLGVVAGAALVASPALALPKPGSRRALGFKHLHTGESLRVTYWAEGQYLDDALAEIDWVLRDFRSGEVQPIRPELLDLLHVVRQKLDSREPFHVISGYRSPATNALLAARSNGVARRSLHMSGMAIDVRLPGRELRQVRRAALRLKRGGVGYYARSGFVHLDIGRVRSW